MKHLFVPYELALKLKEKGLMQIGEQLKRYYHNLTNPDPDEQPWESQTFEQNQNMPVSGY